MTDRARGLYYERPTSFLIHWGDDRSWSIAKGYLYPIWDFAEDPDVGWSADDRDYKGAALVAPYNLLFWEKDSG